MKTNKEIAKKRKELLTIPKKEKSIQNEKCCQGLIDYYAYNAILRNAYHLDWHEVEQRIVGQNNQINPNDFFNSKNKEYKSLMKLALTSKRFDEFTLIAYKFEIIEDLLEGHLWYFDSETGRHCQKIIKPLDTYAKYRQFLDYVTIRHGKKNNVFRKILKNDYTLDNITTANVGNKNWVKKLLSKDKVSVWAKEYLVQLDDFKSYLRDELNEWVDFSFDYCDEKLRLVLLVLHPRHGTIQPIVFNDIKTKKTLDIIVNRLKEAYDNEQLKIELFLEF